MVKADCPRTADMRFLIRSNPEMSLGVEGVDPMAEVWPDDTRVDGAGEKW